MVFDQNDEIHRSIFREANDAFFVVRPADLRILDANPAAQRITGRRRKQLLEMTVEDLLQPGDVAKISDLIAACQSTSHHVGSAEYLLAREDGALPIQLSASRIHTQPETLALLVVRDVSHTHRLEEQLSHARRMEAIGRLSTGIAHELNNLLMVINGYSELLLDGGAASDPRAAGLEQIRAAGMRAAAFTRQLLEFGSRRPSSSCVLDLAEVVEGVRGMLAPLLGERVEVVTQRNGEPLWFEGELARIEQVLVNLAVNARDAMPEGGRLSIEMARVLLTDADVAERPGLAAGPHVVLRVTDTGIGMDEQTSARAFEPFFSTKASAHGTGLGLAMVYSTVQQSRGHVAIESVEGRGTTFALHFPAVGRPPKAVARGEPRAAPAAASGERILVVEDNDGVRQLVERVLRRAGYEVESVIDGAAALELCARRGAWIDLVLSDYLMPGMRGDELGRQLTQRWPGTRVLLMSGCASADGVGEDPALAGAFLRKPFAPAELLARVRAALAP